MPDCWVGLRCRVDHQRLSIAPPYAVKQLRAFVEELRRDVVVHPLTVEIAELAGRIEGEQAARGVRIAFEDLLIGATALHIDYEVVTLNLRHFKLIPGLKVVQL